MTTAADTFYIFPDGFRLRRDDVSIIDCYPSDLGHGACVTVRWKDRRINPASGNDWFYHHVKATTAEVDAILGIKPAADPFTGIDCKGNRWTFPSVGAAIHQCWDLARLYDLPAGRHVFTYSMKHGLDVYVRQAEDQRGDGAMLMRLYEGVSS